MLIGTTQRLVKCRKICIEINYIVLESVDVAKPWSYHIDVLTKKISKKLVISIYEHLAIVYILLGKWGNIVFSLPKRYQRN